MDDHATRDGAGPAGGLSWGSIAWIAGFGATLMSVRFGPAWVLTYHEVFFAEPAREFLLTGDWIAPRIAGLANYQKPPLVCWWIAASMTLFGNGEYAVRLPSLIADILNALFLGAIAARWYGDRIGRIAGLLQLTTFYAIFQSRLAEADMPLCACISGCMLCFCFGVLANPAGRNERRWWSVAYFAGAVAAFLIKGPIGPAFVGLPCGLYAIWSRRGDAWRFLLNPIGWGVLILGCLAWPLMAYVQDPHLLDDMIAHNLDRFSGSMEGGKEGPLYYLYMAPLIMLPWTPFVVGGLRSIGRDEPGRRELWRFLALWFAVPMIIISLSAWKHKHYAIPALPPATILAALGLSRALDSLGQPGRRRLVVAAVVLGVAGLVALVPGIGSASGRGFGPAFTPALLAMAAGLVVLGVGFERLREPRRLAVLFGTTWLVVVLIESFVMPRFDRYRPLTELARDLNTRLPPGAEIDLVCVEDPQITFYLDRPMKAAREYPEFLETLGDSDRTVRYIVGPGNLLPDLQTLGEVEILAENVGPRAVAAAKLRLVAPKLATALREEADRTWR